MIALILLFFFLLFLLLFFLFFLCWLYAVCYSHYEFAVGLLQWRRASKYQRECL